MSKEKAIARFLRRLEMLAETNPSAIEMTDQQIEWVKGLLELDAQGRRTFRGIPVRALSND